MSLKNTQKIKCPDCGTEGEFTIWQSINTKLNPGFLAFGEAGFLTFSEAIFLSGVVSSDEEAADDLLCNLEGR